MTMPQDRQGARVDRVPVSVAAGVTLYIGPGWVIHLSTENGLQVECAPHHTWRLGFIVAIRRAR